MQGRLLQQDDLQPVGFDWSKITKVKPSAMAIRFGFGAVVAVVAALLGMAAGPKIGGLFLAFPAILPASLTLIEKKEGLTRAWSDASGGVLGSCAMAAFAATAMLLLTWSPVVALLLALVAWVIVATGLYFLLRVTGLFLKTDRLISREQSANRTT
jgi:hypothetical protein